MKNDGNFFSHVNFKIKALHAVLGANFSGN